MKHYLTETIWTIPPIKTYRGVIVEKIIGGYKVLNQVVKTIPEVDQAIDKAAEGLNKSIAK